MATSAALLERKAKNHKVDLDHGPPITVTCRRCRRSWEAPLTKGGNVLKNFWLCPNYCNISAGEALRVMHRLKKGEQLDPDLVEAAKDCIFATADAELFTGQKVIDAARALREVEPGRTMHARDTRAHVKDQEG